MKSFRLLFLSVFIFLLMHCACASAASLMVTGNTSASLSFNVTATQSNAWVKLTGAKGLMKMGGSGGYREARHYGFYSVTVSGASSASYEWVPSASSSLSVSHPAWQTGTTLQVKLPKAGTYTVTVTPVIATSYWSGDTQVNWIEHATWRVSEYSSGVSINSRDGFPTGGTASASLRVLYIDQYGRQLLDADTYTISASRYVYPQEISGYTTPSAQYVTYSGGRCYPNAITFIYTPKAPVGASITVYYQDNAGKQLRSPEKLTLTSSGSVYPQEISGYNTPAAEYVTVSGSSCYPSSVVFVYTPKAPASASLTVKYVDKNGNQLRTADTYTINSSRYIYPQEISGYTAPGAQYVTFSSAAGTCYPSSISFVYTPKAPASASLLVTYVDKSGKQLRAPETYTINSSRYIYPREISDYTMPSAQYVTFSSATGTCSPAFISFVYTPKVPASASLTVKYVDKNGKQLRTADTYTINSSRYIYPQEISGYNTPSAEYVTFSSTGYCYPSSLTFVYTPKAPASASLTVSYTDKYGNQLRSPDKYTINSSRYIYPQEISGYKTPEAEYVTFSAASGTCSPSSLTFIYYPKENPAATVTVYCYDGDSTALLQQYTVTLSASGYVSGNAISGYTPETSQQYVTVSNGAASPSSLYFYYHKNGSGGESPQPTTLDEIRSRAIAPIGGSYEAPNKGLTALSDTKLTSLTDGFESTYFQYTIWSSLRANSIPDIVLNYNSCSVRYIQLRGGYQANSSGYTGNARPREGRVEVHHAGGVTTAYFKLKDNYRAGIEGFQTIDLGLTCTGVTQIDFYISGFVAGKSDQNNCVITDILVN